MINYCRDTKDELILLLLIIIALKIKINIISLGLVGSM